MWRLVPTTRSNENSSPRKKRERDDPELGHELGHLGRLDDAEELGRVRAEQDSGREIGRDGREPEAARDQPERPEDGESGGELLERHGLCRQAQQEEPGDHERDAGPLHADRALVHE